jgi:hypothetical protein
MKCYYCQSELVEDSFGNLCPNEECESIDGKIRIEIWNNGTKCWNKNGKRHRENGPAIEWRDSVTEYWINGKRIK